MHTIIRTISIGIALLSVWGSTGLASAHAIKQNNGYSAFMHIDPDDEPSARAPIAMNYLISKQVGSYNQNDYAITVGVVKSGKTLATLKLEPRVFGNAADGVVHYTFPSVADYTIKLHGASLTDASDVFDMNFDVPVESSVVNDMSVAKKSDPQAIVLSVLGLLVLGVIAHVVISRGKRQNSKVQA